MGLSEPSKRLKQHMREHHGHSMGRGRFAQFVARHNALHERGADHEHVVPAADGPPQRQAERMYQEGVKVDRAQR